nr:YdcF family protein [Phaeovibrio sulfidiphilus]
MLRAVNVLVRTTLLLAVAFGGGLLVFAALLPDTVAAPDTPTDAIVVLTGGSMRVSTGIALLAEGKARALFFSGVGEHATLEELEYAADDLHAVLPPDLRSRVVLGYEAQDTFGNARETAAWLQACGYHSIRLVTGSYHMPRSIAEFRAVMPDVEIVPHPVFPGHVKVREWWRWSGTARLIAHEYVKFLAAWIRTRPGIFPGPPAPAPHDGVVCP